MQDITLNSLTHSSDIDVYWSIHIYVSFHTEPHPTKRNNSKIFQNTLKRENFAEKIQTFFCPNIKPSEILSYPIFFPAKIL